MITIDPDDDKLNYWVTPAMAMCGRMGDRPLTPHRVARELAWLEEVGYIVSPRMHDDLCESYAAKLHRIEEAADELATRLQEVESR